MKIEVTSEELQLILDSLDYRENFYAHSGAEVLPELNAVNDLYNRLSELQESQDPVQELRQRIKCLDEDILVQAAERRAELRNDPTVDQSRVGDLIRMELAGLRAERERLHNELHQEQGLAAGLGLEQEIGLER
jgi:hypothetical protein